MGDLMAPCSSSLDFQQHLGIVGELLEEKEEAFHGLQGAALTLKTFKNPHNATSGGGS